MICEKRKCFTMVLYIVQYEACTEKLLNKFRNKAMNNKTSTKKN